jgi:hypothetical protein
MVSSINARYITPIQESGPLENKIILKTIVGSQAYGTNIETSDTDYKGIYIQPIREVLGFSYVPQINVTKDETYYEVKRFLELAMSSNPTMLELLFVPPDCIITQEPEYAILRAHRSWFVTKQARNSFGGYAVEQIKKAKGLNKKMNWEKEKFIRKNVIDFCYLSVDGKSKPLREWLKSEKIHPRFVGMVKLDHMADCYTMYWDSAAQYAAPEHDNPRFKDVKPLGYKGIESEDGNHLLLSSIPKYIQPVTEGAVYFNKSEWNSHTADCRSYEEWLENRNTARYVETQVHGQKIDGKNLMHCIRLIETAKEIASTGTLNVRRPNREDLLKIRRGEVDLNKLIEQAEEGIAKMDGLFAKSTLPDKPDPKKIEELLLLLRGV